MLFIKKNTRKMKNMLNKRYSSTITVKNKLKTPVKGVFKIKIKSVDSIDLFKQKQSVK